MCQLMFHALQEVLQLFGYVLRKGLELEHCQAQSLVMPGEDILGKPSRLCLLSEVGLRPFLLLLILHAACLCTVWNGML